MYMFVCMSCPDGMGGAFKEILFFFFFFCFYTGVVQHLSAGLPLTSCFWIIGAPSVQGAFPMSISVAATPGTRTLTGAMQTSSANALTKSATPTPLLGSKWGSPHAGV